MKIFINNNDNNKKSLINQKFNELINNDSNALLYISLDDEIDKETKANQDLEIFDISLLETVYNIDELEKKDFSKVSAIYISGNDAIKLNDLLNSNESFGKLKQYIIDGGIVYFKGKCAQICGTYLLTPYQDSLEHTKGLCILNNFSLYVKDEEDKEESKHFETKKILCLDHQSGFYIENGKYDFFSKKEIVIYDSGKRMIFNDSNYRKELFEQLKIDRELMQFMDSNVTYGWIDKDKFYHFNNLFNFRKNYRTSTIEEILKYGIGTCIEQAKLIKYFFDVIGLENKLYCHRTYEDNEPFNKIKMHCFVLFKYKDSWYHFEHSDSMKKGIHQYKTIEEALNNITSGFPVDDIRVLTQIPLIPDNISYYEFNQYVNQFGEYQKEEIKNKL